MESREVLLKCLGGASMALLPWPRSPVGADKTAEESPELDNLMEEVWAACYTGWSRLDYGYPIPYLDRAWAQLPPMAGSSARAIIAEHRERLLELVRDAEDSLPLHRAAVESTAGYW
jgi:hypothetical protein